MIENILYIWLEEINDDLKILEAYINGKRINEIKNRVTLDNENQPKIINEGFVNNKEAVLTQIRLDYDIECLDLYSYNTDKIKKDIMI